MSVKRNVTVPVGGEVMVWVQGFREKVMYHETGVKDEGRMRKREMFEQKRAVSRESRLRGEPRGNGRNKLCGDPARVRPHRTQRPLPPGGKASRITNEHARPHPWHAKQTPTLPLVVIGRPERLGGDVGEGGPCIGGDNRKGVHRECGAIAVAENIRAGSV